MTSPFAAQLWLERLVTRLSYRPGWTFTVDPPTSDATMGPSVNVCCATPDVTGWSPDNVVYISERLTIPAPFCQDSERDTVLRMLLHSVDMIESHERLEHFQVDGRPAWDPHPAGRAGLRIAP